MGKNVKCSSKYRAKFCPAVESVGVISERYQLSLPGMWEVVVGFAHGKKFEEHFSFSVRLIFYIHPYTSPPSFIRVTALIIEIIIINL